ncbi:MAG: mevalonate kinase [Sandaracinaceae bacterium]|nr:mevalonate kinase [Sandaracinaceae bacterium]
MSGHGSGKVILLGEHAVVHGVPAIAAGLEAGAVARVVDGEAELRIAPWGVLVRAGDASPLGAAFAALLEARRRDAIDGVRANEHALEAHVTLPGSAGLGSSAALGVAVLRALDEIDGISRDFDRSQAIALAWERVFHGNPSGIDTALALSGGLARYLRNPPPGEPALRPITGARTLSLVVAHSGAPGSTKETVAGVALRKTADPQAFERTLAAFREVVAMGEAALARGDLGALGACFDRCQSLLAGWGVSTPTLDAMCACAKEAGALGAKLTGGGGGGCMIALAEASDRARVREALASRGHEAFETTIGPARPENTERA